MAKSQKIFVLDTSVLLHDFDSISNFDEHNVAIPITVLEELDKFKVGNDTKNFSAREVIRFIDRLSGSGSLQEWIPLGPGLGNFKIIMEHAPAQLNAEDIYGAYKNDHKIINSALFLKKSHPKNQVILVTKDINLRIKAKSLNLHSEDYTTGKILTVDELYTGCSFIDKADTKIINQIYEKGR